MSSPIDWSNVRKITVKSKVEVTVKHGYTDTEIVNSTFERLIEPTDEWKRDASLQVVGFVADAIEKHIHQPEESSD